MKTLFYLILIQSNYLHLFLKDITKYTNNSLVWVKLDSILLNKILNSSLLKKKMRLRKKIH